VLFIQSLSLINMSPSEIDHVSEFSGNIETRSEKRNTKVFVKFSLKNFYRLLKMGNINFHSTTSRKATPLGDPRGVPKYFPQFGRFSKSSTSTKRIVFSSGKSLPIRLEGFRNRIKHYDHVTLKRIQLDNFCEILVAQTESEVQICMRLDARAMAGPSETLESLLSLISDTDCISHQTSDWSVEELFNQHLPNIPCHEAEAPGPAQSSDIGSLLETWHEAGSAQPGQDQEGDPQPGQDQEGDPQPGQDQDQEEDLQSGQVFILPPDHNQSQASSLQPGLIYTVAAPLSPGSGLTVSLKPVPGTDLYQLVSSPATPQLDQGQAQPGPGPGQLSEEEKKMRNNRASAEYRARRRSKQHQLEAELEQLQRRNTELVMQERNLVEIVGQLRARLVDRVTGNVVPARGKRRQQMEIAPPGNKKERH